MRKKQLLLCLQLSRAKVCCTFTHPPIHPSISFPTRGSGWPASPQLHETKTTSPPTSCLTCGKGGRKTSSKRSFGCNMHSKYPNTQTVQIHHLLDQFQWILTPGIVYLYCISLGGRSGVHVPNPLLKKPLCVQWWVKEGAVKIYLILFFDLHIFLVLHFGLKNFKKKKKNLSHFLGQ